MANSVTACIAHNYLANNEFTTTYIVSLKTQFSQHDMEYYTVMHCSSEEVDLRSYAFLVIVIHFCHSEARL